MAWKRLCVTLALALFGLSGVAGAQITNEVKIGDGLGGFPPGLLAAEDYFGTAMTPLPDLDGDGVGEMAVGATGDDTGGPKRGGVWILYLDQDGMVKPDPAPHLIADGSMGGLPTDTLKNGDLFGYSLEWLGDLDGAGPSVGALAVGSAFDHAGPENAGAVYILFLDASANVMSSPPIVKISSAESALGLLGTDIFGSSIAALGDLDGTGPSVQAIAVGAAVNNANRPGFVWILSLDADGNLLSSPPPTKIVIGSPGVPDGFGVSAAALGDLDGAGGSDLALAVGDHSYNGSLGSVVILFLTNAGDVVHCQRISTTSGGFSGELDPGDNFGAAVSAVPSLDNDNVIELAVGSLFDTDGGPQHGAAWILFLNPDGKVKDHHLKFSDTRGCLEGPLGEDRFHGVCWLGDLDPTDESSGELAVGAYTTDGNAGVDTGAVWVLSIEEDYARAACEVFGTACSPGWPGTNSIPALDCLAPPILGKEVSIFLGNSGNVGTAGFLFIGFGAHCLPTALGGHLLVVQAFPLFLVSVKQNGTVLNSPLPDDCDLSGLSVFLQTILRDSGASHGVSFSPGLRLDLGF